MSDKIVNFYLNSATTNFKKEILENLNDSTIKNEEFSETVRNKILAYSL